MGCPGDDDGRLAGPDPLGQKRRHALGARLVAVEELDDMFGGDAASDDAFPDSHASPRVFPADTSTLKKMLLRPGKPRVCQSYVPDVWTTGHPTHTLPPDAPILAGGRPARPHTTALAAHDKAYWRSIAEARFEVPAGATAQQLAPELLATLGGADPELRDDLALSILTSWIYQRKLLGPDDLRPMTLTLEANLRKDIGAIGADGVLLRSFSALTLSVIAARDNEAPFLSAEEYAKLLDEALAYFRDERDTRGFDPAKGWMHSAAHTADLLKFLARNPRLPAAGQSRMLSAMLAKNRECAGAVQPGRRRAHGTDRDFAGAPRGFRSRRIPRLADRRAGGGGVSENADAGRAPRATERAAPADGAVDRAVGGRAPVRRRGFREAGAARDAEEAFLVSSEGLRPSDSPTRSLARRVVGAHRRVAHSLPLVRLDLDSSCGANLAGPGSV